MMIIIRMDDNRLTNRVFEWDIHKNGAWASKLLDLCVRLCCEGVLTNKVQFDLCVGKELVSLKTRDSWISGVRSMPKLLTFCKNEARRLYRKLCSVNLLKKKMFLRAHVRFPPSIWKQAGGP